MPAIGLEHEGMQHGEAPQLVGEVDALLLLEPVAVVRAAADEDARPEAAESGRLLSGEKGGIQAGKVFGGAGLGLIYKFLMGETGGLSFWKAQPEWHPGWYPGALTSTTTTTGLT